MKKCEVKSLYISNTQEKDKQLKEYKNSDAYIILKEYSKLIGLLCGCFSKILFHSSQEH